MLLHFRITPFFAFVIDDSSWKNAAESFTVALTLTLGGVQKYNSAKNSLAATLFGFWLLIFFKKSRKEVIVLFLSCILS